MASDQEGINPNSTNVPTGGPVDYRVPSVAVATFGPSALAGSVQNYLYFPTPNGTDDTSGCQAILNSVGTFTVSPGATVFGQPGAYKFSAPLNPKSGTVIEGAGTFATTFVGLASFPSTVNTGIIDYNTPGVTLFSGCEVRNLAFDLTATNQTANRVNGIHQTSNSGTFPSAMQHCNFEGLRFECGVGNVGILLEGLGATATVSHNITVNRIWTHNGGGSVALYLNATSNAGLYRDITITNIFALIDVTGINDDRVAIVGNYPSGAGGNAEARDIFIQNVKVHIVSGATGVCNAVKLDTGVNCYLHNISIRDLWLYNAAGSAYGSTVAPINVLLTGASQFQDLFVDGVFGYQTSAIVVRMNRTDRVPVVSFKNVRLLRNFDAVRCLEVYVSSAPAGDEMLIFRDIQIDSQTAHAGNVPVGIMLASGAAGQGATGLIEIDGVDIQNTMFAISNNFTEAGGAQNTAHANIRISRSSLVTNNNNALSMVAGSYTIKDCPGYNPQVITAPAVSTPLTNNYGVDVFVSFIANAAGTTFTVNTKALGATPANAQGGFFWPPGTVMSYVNAPASWVFIGN